MSNLEARVKEIDVSRYVFEIEAYFRKTTVYLPERRKVKRARKQFGMK